ncbi:hypothetical protein ACFY1L_09665 [Streptomyces sp. NPDC001663]|uniref:LppU/SCO3897 family protein n=1 Tax=Streptomyces sp. NPDC001663 TaxID=3364597 RepID=UPI00369DF353
MNTPPPIPPSGPYAAPYPGPYGVPGPAPAPMCEVCGAAPAAAVTIRAHQGMVVLMRSMRRQGVYCRPCGMAFFREMQADTMLQGWWGLLSAFVTPLFLLLNLGARATLRALPEPTTWGWRPPLDPGKPILKRPAGLIALIPLIAIAVLVTAFTVLMIIGLVAGDDDTPKPLTAGSCVRNEGSWTDQDLQPVPCDSALAAYRVKDPGTDECPAGAYLADLKYSGDGTTNLCLVPLSRR